MKSPFPGMDPYLETVWPDVHTSLLTYIRDAMNPSLPGDLRARLQERVYVEDMYGQDRYFEPDIHVSERPRRGTSPSSAATAVLEAPPDVARPAYSFELPEITQRYIDIIDLRNDRKVVTTIELLSPANKVAGAGRRKYIEKQMAYHDAGVNLVEIDLIRAGGPTTVATASSFFPSGKWRAMYHASIVDFAQGGRIDYFPFPLRQRLPRLPIPLRPQDQPVPLDLQAVLDLTYERGYYADDLPYAQPLDPPLNEADRR